MSVKLCLRMVATIVFAMAVQAVGAQQATKFSMKEAVDYALKNNPALKSKKIDQDIADQRVRETLASGLPQISTNITYTNNIQIPTQRLPNFINSALPPGSPQGPEFINAQFGIANSLGAVAQLNQLLFDGTYFLGVRAAKEFVKMSEYTTRQSEVDVQVNTIKAYYSVLMAERRLALLDENIRRFDSTLYNLKAQVEQGFAEAVDTSRIALSKSNLELDKARTEDQRKIMLNVLKIQMGYDVNQPIELTDKIESIETGTIMDVSGEGNVANRNEYKLLDQQVKLGMLDKKRFQYGYYPTLNGFLTHQQNTYANKGQLSQLGNPWFPGTAWGLTLHIPIFSGFRQAALIKQANFRLEQYQISKKQFEQVYVNEVYTARTNYLRAIQNYEQQKKNADLAREIIRIAKVKLQEGLGTSLEYTTAEIENNTSQTNMVISLYDLKLAELEYRRATGMKIIE